MATKRPNKKEQAHLEKVKELGCVACYVQAGIWGTPGDIHHIREGQGMAQRSSWHETLCLCKGHHQHDDKAANKIAVHGNSGYKAFTSRYGSEKDLLTLTLNNI